jgi:very-short-patch-repair endonuclease
MRANPTEAERRMWNLLRAKRFIGYKFKRQVIIDYYIADFVNLAHRLIVEADGSQHAESEYDQRRDAYLKAQGFHVVRFWNNEIAGNMEGVSLAVYHALTSSPLPLRERARDLARPKAQRRSNLVAAGEGGLWTNATPPSPRVARQHVAKPTLSSPARGEG